MGIFRRNRPSDEEMRAEFARVAKNMGSDIIAKVDGSTYEERQLIEKAKQLVHLAENSKRWEPIAAILLAVCEDATMVIDKSTLAEMHVYADACGIVNQFRSAM